MVLRAVKSGIYPTKIRDILILITLADVYCGFLKTQRQDVQKLLATWKNPSRLKIGQFEFFIRRDIGLTVQNGFLQYCNVLP